MPDLEPLEHDWQPISSAPDQEEVWTKIHDHEGDRNFSRLTRRGERWWVNGAIKPYPVHYFPTHWSRT